MLALTKFILEVPDYRFIDYRFIVYFPPLFLTFISFIQVVKTRMEADEVTVKLELCDKENKALKEEMAKEIENASAWFLFLKLCRPVQFLLFAKGRKGARTAFIPF